MRLGSRASAHTYSVPPWGVWYTVRYSYQTPVGWNLGVPNIGMFGLSSPRCCSRAPPVRAAHAAPARLRPLAASPLQLRPGSLRRRASTSGRIRSRCSGRRRRRQSRQAEGLGRGLPEAASPMLPSPSSRTLLPPPRATRYTTARQWSQRGLNLDIASIGIITSIFPLFYGCSKFVSGVVGDVLSARAMLACGLGLTVRFAAPRAARHGRPHLHHLHSPAHTILPRGGRQHHVRPRLDAAVVLRAVGPQRHPAGLGRPGVREDHHVVVRHQGARHVLGALEHLAQPRRVPRAAARRHRRARPRLAVGRLRARPHRPLRRRTRVRHRSQLAGRHRPPAGRGGAGRRRGGGRGGGGGGGGRAVGRRRDGDGRAPPQKRPVATRGVAARVHVPLRLLDPPGAHVVDGLLPHREGVSDFARQLPPPPAMPHTHRRHRRTASTAATTTTASADAPPDALRRRRRASRASSSAG